MIDSNDFITVGELEVVENVNNEDLILFEQDEEIKTFKGKILNDIKEKAEDVFLSLGDKEYLTTERKETIVEAINNVDLTAKNAKKVVDTLNINVVKAVSIENDLEDDSEVDFNLIEKVDSINTELETLKSNLSDCVGYRKFNGEWITAQYTLEDKTRNLVIEGDSIVNLASGLRSTELGVLADNVFTVTAAGGRRGNLYFDNAKGQIKNKETYTIIMNITKNTLVGNTSSFKFNLNNYSIENYGYFKVENGFTGILMKVIRTATTTVIDTPYLETYTNQTSGELEISNIYILKGDWSNKTIPNYFEGLKSVGDLQENGKYKIGLISSNYNLFNSFTNIKALDADNVVLKNNYLEGTYKGNAWIIFKIATPRFKKNTTIIIRGKYTNEVEATGKIEIFQDLNKTGTMTACDIKKGEFVAKLKLKHDTDTLAISARNANGSSGKKVVFSKLIIEKDTDLNLDVEGNYDKKQILLQEPLNGIGNVRDIKDNKKIIRKTSLRVLNGSEDWILQRQNDNIIRFMIPKTSPFMNNIKSSSLCLCEGFTDMNSITPTPDEYCVGVNVEQNDGLVFRVPKSRLETPDVSGFKKFLAKKNIKIVLMLEKYTVEEVEQDMCLNTYKDLTHIYTDTEIQGNISFSTLIDLGTTINRLENTNTANLKLIEEQENRLIEQAYSILDNDTRLCMLELGI